MKPTLVIDDAIPFLEGRLEDSFNCIYMPGQLIAPAHISSARGLLVRTRTKCGPALLAGSPVEFVATGTIGLDHIDTGWCTARGIHWQNAPGCNAPAVAQYVWAALLRLGFDLSNHTLGVVGKGNVGSLIAEWGRQLGVRVIVSDPPRQEAGHTDEDYLPLHELMQQADAVTFHTPLTRSGAHPSFHLASEEALSALKPGAILINAARGGVVDEEALLKLLPEKKWRLAIDTWEGEPSVNPLTLKAADIATFHIAGYSEEGKQRASRAIIEGLNRHFNTHISTEGLAPAYSPLPVLTPGIISSSYDIMADDATMRAQCFAPADFERLRNTYPLRPEVKPIHNA